MPAKGEKENADSWLRRVSEMESEGLPETLGDVPREISKYHSPTVRTFVEKALREKEQNDADAHPLKESYTPRTQP